MWNKNTCLTCHDGILISWLMKYPLSGERLIPLNTTNNKCLGHCSIPIFTYHISMYIYIYIYSRNPFVLHFGDWIRQQKVFSNQINGHLRFQVWAFQKINMEPKKWRTMEDDLPFPSVSKGWFSGSMFVGFFPKTNMLELSMCFLFRFQPP